jgi:hypothetical protein
MSGLRCSALHAIGIGIAPPRGRGGTGELAGNVEGALTLTLRDGGWVSCNLALVAGGSVRRSMVGVPREASVFRNVIRYVFRDLLVTYNVG